MPRISRLLLCAFLIVSVTRTALADPKDYFAIHFVDDETGRGIPLVLLQTTYKMRYVSDSAGYVAFNEPGLMNGGDVWFDISSYGYDSPAGPFNFKGLVLQPAAGKSKEIKLKRRNIAERLYRMTGYGIYRDSVLLGKTPPIKEGLLNAQVTGQDTVQTAIYRGKMYWLWQDTDRISFALGCFSMTGATSALPEQLDPDKGIDFQYFADKPGAFARAMAIVPRKGNNPIWVDGLTVVKDSTGRERLLARYVAANKDFSIAEEGLVLYNDQKDVFERLRQFDDPQNTLAPAGKPFRVMDGDRAYVCFPNGVRVADRYEQASDPSKYETFTCLKSDGEIDRDPAGKLIWSWRQGAKRFGDKETEACLKSGKVQRDELPFQLIDIDTHKPIQAAGIAIAWNAYLKRWTLIFIQKGGDSNLGEVWFATANSPQGPWREARKVATHAMPKNNNDFYNPIQHPELQQQGGKIIYFEGTFVDTFSGNPTPTPYYDYNNIMYRLDLSDPRLSLPPPPPGLTAVTPQ